MLRLALFVFLICVLGCKGKSDKEYLIVNKQIEKELSEFKGDSISHYVYNVNDLDYKKDLYYLSMNGLIYMLDNNFQFIKSFGVQGFGPNEFVNPEKLAIGGDKIYLMDSGKLKLMILQKDKNLIKETDIKDRFSTLNAFVVDEDNHMYFSTPLSNSLFSKYKIPDFDNSVKQFKNPNILSESDNMDFKLNLCHVLNTSFGLVAIPPISEKILIFDKENASLIQEFSLPKELTNSRIRFKESEIKSNSQNKSKQYNIINDVYVFNDKIYLLLCENLGDEYEYYSNKVLVVNNESGLCKLEKVIQLEGESYRSICVNDNYILGFETMSSTINVFRR